MRCHTRVLAVSSTQTYNSWSTCADCGFQGLLVFQSRANEDYSDASALGYMLDSHCPACGQDDPVLVVAEEYRQMVFMASNRNST